MDLLNCIWNLKPNMYQPNAFPSKISVFYFKERLQCYLFNVLCLKLCSHVIFLSFSSIYKSGTMFHNSRLSFKSPRLCPYLYTLSPWAIFPPSLIIIKYIGNELSQHCSHISCDPYY